LPVVACRHPGWIVPWTKTTTDLCLARGTVRKANRPTKSDAGGAGGSGGGGVGTYP
jgi:hypothetical protein